MSDNEVAARLAGVDVATIDFWAGWWPLDDTAMDLMKGQP